MKIVTLTSEIPSIAKGSVLACPGCDAVLEYACHATPGVDECGFESYRFRCGACGVVVLGIVDPADQTLLLTVAS